MVLIEALQKLLTQAFMQAYPNVLINNWQAEVTRSTAIQFGHYQCNSVMKLTKKLGVAPREIATQVVNKLQALDTKNIFNKLDIAGPGFINIWLNKKFIESEINNIVLDERVGVPKAKIPQKIALDFSSPNTAKEMHVGHLRSTIIGDALARILEFLGHDVLRLNHIGDWGTQFGMLIAYLKQYQPEVAQGKLETDLSHLMQWYKAAKKVFDEDAAFKLKAQSEVVALQSGEASAIQIWQMICDISQKAYHQIYDYLDVKLIDRGESFYNPMLSDVVQDLTARGYLVVNEGAKCLFLDGFKNREGEPLPMMLQKSDGGYNYDTTDMAAVKHRIEIEKCNRLIYVTDSGQSTHFAMLFSAAKKVGYASDEIRLDHVPFGLVLGPDGKKYKTRSGETEKLMDLLTEGVARAKNILSERNQVEAIFTEKEIENTAQIIGISAIKYADLAGNRIQDYVFEYDKMLKLEGNTAAFLIYAYVRTAGIKRKLAKIENLSVQNLSPTTITLDHPMELNLAIHLLRFPEMVTEVADDLFPNRLCEYLFELANHFHQFFRDCKIIGSEQQASRLLLSELTAKILKLGMGLLGIKTVEKM
jgi:arginyl-tRNA synthetase